MGYSEDQAKLEFEDIGKHIQNFNERFYGMERKTKI